MIYKKDGKLLVAAGGLCSSCCYEFGNDCNACETDPFPDGQTPKYIDITFSGVTLCAGESWPDNIDLNTTWTLTQDDGDACLWTYEVGDWYIEIDLDAVGDTSRAFATDAASAEYYWAEGLAHCLATAENVANDHAVGDCNPGNVVGYDGTASWEF